MNTRTGIALTLASMVMIVTACEERSNRNSTPATNSTTGTGATSTDRTDSGRPNPSPTSPSTGQPNNSNSKLADDVRAAITADTAFSQNAKNVEVTSDQSGVVTLRGQVATQSEKDAIETRVKAISGVTRVVNEIRVGQR